MELVERLFVPSANKRLNELAGVLLFFCAILLLLALVSYAPSDPSLNTAASVDVGRTAHNWTGIFGAYAADILLQLLGFSAFLLPMMVAVAGWRWFHSRAAGAQLVRLAGAAGILFTVPTLLALLPWQLRMHQAIPQEGLIGRILGDTLIHYFNRPGSYVLCFAVLVAALYMTTSFTAAGYRTWGKTRFAFVHSRWQRFQDWRAERRRVREEKALEKRRAESQKPLVEAQLVQNPNKGEPAAGGFLRRSRNAAKLEVEAVTEESSPNLLQRSGTWLRRDEAPAADEATPAPAPVRAVAAPVAPLGTREPERVLSGIDRMMADAAPNPSTPPAPLAFVEPSVTQRADAAQKAKTMLAKSAGSFQLPPSSLLQRADERQQVDEDELKDLARQMTEKYAEFSVLGQVTQINPGPVVTTFEFKPEPGVKYSRVVGLSDDICLALRAESILIERMPGKSTVGLQVPNHKRETIWLREVIEAPEFNNSRAKLPLAMGKDINGRIATADLAIMPHLLIAGSTGAGKSVALNAMIMSLLYRTSPDQVRLIMVDPKRLELGVYEGVPHLYTPIITEPKLAANALRNAVREMERRLKLLAEKGVRNIDQYNRLFDEGDTPSLFSGVDEDGVALDANEEPKPLPYIVIVIDELADLMMLDRANVEESVTRLAQMARAVGIHLVLATQRPSVDVITGLIKANFPARVSFRVATKVDSRTILDANGAEALLGRGDMLYLPSGSSRVQRLHAPFVTEKEIAAVVEFWRSQAQAEYVEGFLKSADEDVRGGEAGMAGEDELADNDDPMYDDAVRVVIESGKASTSLLQRRLRIGYGRAAHLIDLMEQDGLVGAADGPRPREVLKRPDWLNEVDATMR